MGAITIILLITISFALPGTINRVRAIIAGRKGVSFYQHINNVDLLFRKGAVYTPVATWITQVAPAVYLGASLTALLFIPIGNLPALLGFEGDVVMFCYLLSITRLSLILTAMDSGSSFQGMGASREALYGALVEPAMFAVAGTLALVSGNISFSGMFIGVEGITPELIIVFSLLTYTLVKIMSVEAGRIPIDDTRTHLELTMIHEVMILDLCGVDLAMVTVGGWIKMGAIATLAANALACAFTNSWIVVVLFTVAIGVVVGIVESIQARNRLSRNSTYILTIVAMAVVLFMVTYILLRNIIA